MTPIATTQNKLVMIDKQKSTPLFICTQKHATEIKIQKQRFYEKRRKQLEIRLYLHVISFAPASPGAYAIVLLDDADWPAYPTNGVARLRWHCNQGQCDQWGPMNRLDRNPPP